MTRPQRPETGPVFSLADELVFALAEAAPIQATMVGVPGHDHRVGDLGPAGVSRMAALLAGFREVTVLRMTLGIVALHMGTA